VTLHEILKAKGTRVYSVEPDAFLQEAVRQLTEHNVGALLVCQRDATTGEQLLGIITERDVLHVCARGPLSLSEIRVREVMSAKLVTGTPEDSIEDTMGLLTQRRIRHLPILSEGRLVGIVSIGDVVKAQHDRLAMENQFMKNYIQTER
jgi:CBS domain-containing protein